MAAQAPPEADPHERGFGDRPQERKGADGVLLARPSGSSADQAEPSERSTVRRRVGASLGLAAERKGRCAPPPTGGTTEARLWVV